MTYEHLELSTSDGVARLKLNRPDRRNAMSPELGGEIVRAVAELNDESALRAVIVSGAGKGFSSGGDFALLEQRTRCPADDNRQAMRAFYDSYLAIRDLRVPSIAAIHGYALGAGLCFALACDLRIAAADAKLGLTFVRVGLHPGMGATFLLPRIVGAAKAAELLLTGRTIDAAEAWRIGLVSEVVPPADLEATAGRLAAEIALGAPVAIAQLKRTLRDHAFRSLDEALDREAGSQAIDYGTEDMREAIAAFGAKRAPVFRGR